MTAKCYICLGDLIRTAEGRRGRVVCVEGVTTDPVLQAVGFKTIQVHYLDVFNEPGLVRYRGDDGRLYECLPSDVVSVKPQALDQWHDLDGWRGLDPDACNGRETGPEKRQRVAADRPGSCDRCPYHDRENRGRRPRTDTQKNKRRKK